MFEQENSDKKRKKKKIKFKSLKDLEAHRKMLEKQLESSDDDSMNKD